MDDFLFQLPESAPPDIAAVAELGRGLARLTDTVDELHQQLVDLREQLAAAGPRGRRAPMSVPWPLRWRDLDRDAAADVWGWLIDWTGWMVERYQLAEEIPSCWPLHPPLIEELTGLAAAWHDAYDNAAPADALLVWHERLARCRSRLREFDETRCRSGVHTERHLELAWPGEWEAAASFAASADIAARPAPDGGPRPSSTAAVMPAGEEPLS